MARPLQKAAPTADWAGAIAAIFNAPIAGVMFATEIIMLGNYEMESFGAVVISAGMAPAVSQAYYGAYPTFIVTSHDMIGVREIPFYLLFGLLLGVISVIYIKVFYGIKDFLAAINLPQHVKAIAGAFCIGLIGIFLPQVMGDGYASITEALNGHYSLTLFVVLIFFKILATSITLGSGGAGGVFAPSLFIGAMTGDAFESAVHRLFPHMTSNPGAYATVGIGAFLAAVTHAPLTGIFLLIEMTGDYKVIIPVMFASITGLFVSKALLKDSIDTFELSRRGVDLFIGKEMSILQAIKVKDIMRKDFTTVNEHEPINTVSDMIINGDGLCFPVIRDSGEIAGIISMQDVKAVMLEEYIKTVVTAGQLATEDVVLLNNLDNMKTALERFSINDQDEIPVVDFLNHKKIVGMLNRSDMIAAYIRAVMQ
ncbi:chloride channel protein [Candidatus Magnetobacterium casensis]|uniref:Chloride channel protein n=2 Tax=Candidatus Magnetobacterium casense TaxID=1455061 RepID=A0ABS6RY20_9BACT|nr:chloride channel protein [Candidatus Magnetobacterium casensis]MBV6341521.1 chloride channel protein [Candidatus Magnetobacterium casensis]